MLSGARGKTDDQLCQKEHMVPGAVVVKVSQAIFLSAQVLSARALLLNRVSPQTGGLAQVGFAYLGAVRALTIPTVVINNR
ncbi:hypothetical protein GN956_G2039 [Arapaima gigas]